MTYRPGEFGKLIGKSVSTLRRWDREGRLCPKKSLGGHRYYTDEDLALALNLDKPQPQGNTVVYCRVSSQTQKSDLLSQIQAMETYCLSAGIAVDEWVEEIGSGMNFKRREFLRIMKSIRNFEVKRLIVAHKDRLARFGFEFLEEFASWYGCKIEVVNQESLSPPQEMVEDLIVIIHLFSYRLYGLRKYKDTIKKLINS